MLRIECILKLDPPGAGEDSAALDAGTGLSPALKAFESSSAWDTPLGLLALRLDSTRS